MVSAPGSIVQPAGERTMRGLFGGTMPRKVIEATSAVPAVGGFIQQIGPPAEVYAFPATTFVGGFVGSPPMNFLRLPVENGCVRLGALTLGSPTGSEGHIMLGVRPEDLQVTVPAEGFPFILQVAEPLGSHIILTGETHGQQVRVMVAPEASVRVGATMSLRPRSDRIVWMDPASGATVGRGEVAKVGTEAAGD